MRNRHRRATGGVLRAASSFPTRLFSAPSKKKVFEGGRSRIRAAYATGNGRLPASSDVSSRKNPRVAPSFARRARRTKSASLTLSRLAQSITGSALATDARPCEARPEAPDHDPFRLRGPPGCDNRASQRRAHGREKPAPFSPMGPWASRRTTGLEQRGWRAPFVPRPRDSSCVPPKPGGLSLDAGQQSGLVPGLFRPWHRRGVLVRQHEDSWSPRAFYHARSSEHTDGTLSHDGRLRCAFHETWQARVRPLSEARGQRLPGFQASGLTGVSEVELATTRVVPSK